MMQVMVLPDGTAVPLIHWTYFDGRWRIGCAPHVEPDGNWHKTDDVRAVNCRYCLSMPDLKAVQQRMRAAPVEDFVPWTHYLIGDKLACGKPVERETVRTNDARIVTCKACQESEVCCQAAQTAPGIPGRDFFRG